MSFFDIARPPAPTVYDEAKAKPDAIAPATAVASGAAPNASAAPAASTPTATPTATATTTPSATATATPTATASGADNRSTEFKAVTNDGEARNGTTLMVEAYSVLWMLLMGWIFLLWRKQNDLNVRLDDLERAIDTNADKIEKTDKK